ncbi:MAG TPA: NUDIX hydrolase [Polyangiaceae bacterium]|nr:NUDIX hydrolase [Polyangiaceae bacterium]
MIDRRAGVRQLLHAYAPSDARELAFRTQMLQLTESPGDPFSREHFTPGHFTASAFILSPDRKAVLLIHHQKLARWLQPGGHLEPEDDSVLATAEREVREEVNLAEVSLGHEGIFDIDVHPIPQWKSEAAHQHFDVRFLFVAKTVDFTASSEVTAGRWFPLTDLGEIASDESVRRALRKLG